MEVKGDFFQVQAVQLEAVSRKSMEKQVVTWKAGKSRHLPTNYKYRRGRDGGPGDDGEVTTTVR